MSGTQRAVEAVVRRYGPLSAEAQKILGWHCRNNNVSVAIRALAPALLDLGVTSGSIPKPQGLEAHELLDRAEYGIRGVVEGYHQCGGVVLAKSYTSPHVLRASIAELWLQELKDSVIEVTEELGNGLTTEEINGRLAVVSQAVAKTLLDRMGGTPVWREAMLNSDPSTIGLLNLPAVEFEGLCRGLAETMFTVFQDPNAWIHHNTHGAT